MTSKPTAARRHLNFQSLAKDLESKLERTLSIRNDKIYQQFSANFNGNENRPQQSQQIKKTAVATVQPVTKPPRKALNQQHHHQTAVYINNSEGVRRSVSDDELKDDIISDDADADSNIDMDHHHRHQHERTNWSQLVADRDQHIEKLIRLVDELHAHNARFAAENEHLLVQQQEDRANAAKQPPCADCAMHLQRQQCLQLEIDEKSAQMSTNAQDVRMLKTLVYRLNVQLERHQDDLRRLGATADAFEPPPAGTSSAANTVGDQQQQQRAWGTIQTHTLAPLLNAYTAQLAEQRDLIAQHELDSAHFTGRLKTVLAENEHLHSDLDTLRHATSAWHTEQTRLRAQLDVCRQRAEVQTRRADLAKQKLVEVLRCYEQKVQAQHLDVERLQEAYARVNGELVGLRSLQQQPQAVADSVRECQRLFEQLRDRHEEDRSKMGVECEALRTRCAEADAELRRTAQELSTVRQTLREREEEAATLTRKNAALRQSLGRVRLSRDAFRTRLKDGCFGASSEAGANPVAAAMMVEAPQPQKQCAVAAAAAAVDVEAIWRDRADVHARYVREIERLTRKLQQRDNTLRRLLQAKCRIGGGASAETASGGHAAAGGGGGEPDERG